MKFQIKTAVIESVFFLTFPLLWGDLPVFPGAVLAQEAHPTRQLHEEIASRLWCRAVVAGGDLIPDSNDDGEQLRLCLEAILASRHAKTPQCGRIFAYVGQSDLTTSLECIGNGTDALLKWMTTGTPIAPSDLGNCESELADLFVLCTRPVYCEANDEFKELMALAINTKSLRSVCLVLAASLKDSRRIALQRLVIESEGAIQEKSILLLKKYDSDNGVSWYLGATVFAKSGDIRQCRASLITAISKKDWSFYDIPFPQPVPLNIPETPFASKYGLAGKTLTAPILSSFVLNQNALRERSFDFRTKYATLHFLDDLKSTDGASDRWKEFSALVFAAGLRLQDDSPLDQFLHGAILCSRSRRGAALHPVQKREKARDSYNCACAIAKLLSAEVARWSDRATLGTRLAVEGVDPIQHELDGLTSLRESVGLDTETASNYCDALLDTIK